MRPWWLVVGLFGLTLLGAGCQGTGTLLDASPVTSVRGPACRDANPVFIALGPNEYGRVFETVIQTLTDYGFEIAESNRYDGRLETMPRTAPGLFLFLKPGSPEVYDRWLSTLQSYRHRVSVVIQPAEQGGYFIEMIVRKELQDIAKPSKATVGQAIFRTDSNVDRQFEVIDPNYLEPSWIYKGRDENVEQELIRRLKRSL